MDSVVKIPRNIMTIAYCSQLVLLSADMYDGEWRFYGGRALCLVEARLASLRVCETLQSRTQGGKLLSINREQFRHCGTDRT